MRDFSPGSTVEPHGPAAFPQSRAEYLYRFLDNRLVNGREGRWRTCIYSVVEAGDESWVQTAVVGPFAQSVLLRIHHAAEPTSALQALESWLSTPQSRADRVIEVPACVVDASPLPEHRVPDGWEGAASSEHRTPAQPWQ